MTSELVDYMVTVTLALTHLGVATIGLIAGMVIHTIRCKEYTSSRGRVRRKKSLWESWFGW